MVDAGLMLPIGRAKFARQQPDLPSRAEAIRRLVELGLKAKKK
jgi:hypothetical protein